MFLLISFFLLLLFLPTPVSADDFCTNGDSAFNSFRQTTAIAVSQYPGIESGIEYLEDDVFGSSTDYVLQNYTILDMATVLNMRRIPNILDRVSGPPGTDIDLIYLYLNETGHDIEILKLAMFFSRDTSSNGDWTKVLDFKTSNANWGLRDVFFSNKWLVKKGFLKEYEGLGVIERGQGGVFVLDSMTISNPIQINNVEIEENEGILNMKVVVGNSSNEMLENIQFEHYDYSTEFTLYPYEEILLTYSLEKEEEINSSSIHNPNSRTECIVLGSPFHFWDRSSAVTVLALRHKGWVNGAYVQPAEESFCITRIPYTFTSDIYDYYNDDEVLDYERDYEKEEESDNMVEVKEESSAEPIYEVLGVVSENVEIFTLPKTGKIY
jgi:hypothetical protein